MGPQERHLSHVDVPAGGRVSPPGLLAAFDAASIGLALVALDGHFLRGNGALSRLTGRDDNGLYLARLPDLVHPDEASMEADALQQVASGETDADLAERRYVALDGTTTWVRRGITLVRDHAGAPLYLALHVVDISDRVATELAMHQSELWYRALVQHLSDLVLVIGADDGIHYVSPSVERLLGLSPEAVVGRTATDLIHPDDYDAAAAELARRLGAGSEAVPVELRCRRGDGSWVWFEVTASRLPTDVADDWLVVNGRDITERKLATAAQDAIEARFQAAFSQSPIGIVFTGLDGRLMWSNDALGRFLGKTTAELVGVDYRDLWPDARLVQEQAQVATLLDGTIDSFQFERRYTQAEGRVRWGLVYVSLVRDAEGAPHSLLGQVEDITDRKVRELALEHDAEHEPLTGLWNRSGFCRLLEQAWRERSGVRELAVLFVDLDGFKLANDVHGHETGDEVLVHVAQRLRQVVRTGDVVGRWGGDEFVVLCTQASGALEADDVAQRLCKALAEPFRVMGGEVAIGASVGVSVDSGQSDPYVLLRESDAASYTAKRLGRGRVEHA
jgi:diguanylate cyclase (GGDEF)-like protein/PAS domain S-box-containing protein